jgi:hypothetical protein
MTVIWPRRLSRLSAQRPPWVRTGDMAGMGCAAGHTAVPGHGGR